MATLEELLGKGEKVVKGEKKKPKESEIRERYNLDALIEIAKRILKNGETYKYPHKEFAEIIGFNPVGKIRRPTNSGDIIEEAYNVSLPNDLRAFIESKPIEDFDDTVRIRMSRNGKVVVEPFKEYKRRLEKRRERGYIWEISVANFTHNLLHNLLEFFPHLWMCINPRNIPPNLTFFHPSFTPSIIPHSLSIFLPSPASSFLAPIPLSIPLLSADTTYI